jgi:hypothetical protein
MQDLVSKLQKAGLRATRGNEIQKNSEKVTAAKEL